MSNDKADAPLDFFRDGHAEVFKILAQLDGICELERQPGMEVKTRETAVTVWRFFREAVMAHHEDEEDELFPAVLAVRGLDAPTRARLETLARQLTVEHREIEALWGQLEPRIRKLARGKLAILDPEKVSALTRKYAAHAQLEETEFLPLADRSLSTAPDELRHLARALHGRHSGKWIAGYV